MAELVGNASKVQRLISMGAIWPELLEELTEELDSKDAPHVVMSFQLPYPIRIEPGWHRVRGSRSDPNRYAYVQARLTSIEVDHFGHVAVRQATGESDEERILLTQMVALIPLWEKRAEYYAQYQRCIVDEEIAVNRVIVPTQYSWRRDHRAITVADYEFDVVSRMTQLINVMLLFLLPNYSILSLMECPIPAKLGGLFGMLSPGRVKFNNPPEPIVSQLLRQGSPKASRLILGRELKTSMKLGLRELGQFEHQLFAMNRLCGEGEKALAVIGTLALLEWFLNRHFGGESKPNKQVKRQESLSILLKAGDLDFLPEITRRRLSEANQIRNALVHGAPPGRYSLISTDARAGQELEYQGNLISSVKVRELIQLALDVYRQSNLYRHRPRQASS